MAKTHNYSSSIKTSKKEEFDIFLRERGVSEDEIIFKPLGDYLLYSIDFSKKENHEIHYIRKELNDNLTNFL